MNKEAREEYLQEKRRRQGVGRGGRGRGGRVNQSRRLNSSKQDADPEMDIAEISKNGVECFNTEITNAMSDMSSLEDDSHESVRPTILFTNAEEKEETNGVECWLYVRKSNVRIANSILEGNLPFTVDDQLWRTDLVTSFMFLGDKHL